MANHSKAAHHLQQAMKANASRDAKGAMHHVGHALLALRESRPGSGFAGSPAPASTPPRPPAQPSQIEGGEPDDADGAQPVGAAMPGNPGQAVAAQSGNGLMARLRSFGRSPSKGPPMPPQGGAKGPTKAPQGSGGY